MISGAKTLFDIIRTRGGPGRQLKKGLQIALQIIIAIAITAPVAVDTTRSNTITLTITTLLCCEVARLPYCFIAIAELLLLFLSQIMTQTETMYDSTILERCKPEKRAHVCLGLRTLPTLLSADPGCPHLPGDSVSAST